MDALGLIFPAIIVVVICLVFIAAEKQSARNYDERQLAFKGSGYKYAVFTMAVALGAGSLLYDDTAPLPLSAGDYMYCTLALGACVFTVYAIWHEAYFSLHEKHPLTYGITATVVGAACMFAGFNPTNPTSIGLAAFLLTTGITQLVRLALNRRDSAADVEDDA